MRVAVLLVLALAILLFGTIQYIRVGVYGQGPIRLMSPSIFSQHEDIGGALAKRFWPSFHKNDSIHFHLHFAVGDFDGVLRGLYRDLKAYGLQTENLNIKVSAIKDGEFKPETYVKENINWFVLPLHFSKNIFERSCDTILTWECLAVRAAKRNYKKRKDTNQLVGLIEDHHNNNFFLFIQNPR